MAGFSALGTLLKMSSAGGTLATTSTAAAIADLTNISGPTMSAEEIDVSSHDSTGYFREFVAGFLDAGEISLEGNLSTAAQGATTLNDAFKDRTSRQFNIVFPKVISTSSSLGDGAYLRWKFDGTVTGIETAAPYDDKATFSSTIRITGAPFLIASSSSGY